LPKQLYQESHPALVACCIAASEDFEGVSEGVGEVFRIIVTELKCDAIRHSGIVAVEHMPELMQ
jgi:hypothetical protein